MPSTLNRNKVRKYLKNFELQKLFIEELGWDHGGVSTKVDLDGCFYYLEVIAQKRGMVAYQYIADSESVFPDHSTRQKIERLLAKSVREHIIVYATHDKATQYWQWVKREPNQPDRTRSHIYHRDTEGESLIQKLENLVFTLDEEQTLTIVDVSGRIRAAFDVEKVTKKFYERFKKEHKIFLDFIEGIENLADREWYASLMLNRMMFIYFIQKRGFLDNDKNYLSNRLKRMKEEFGNNSFQTFYRLFLIRLFHEGLSQPAIDRAPELSKLLGKIPYLNGGLFQVHDLERNNDNIEIPDLAFEQIFRFLDSYHWHLDDRPLHNDNEINPDVLGYIFEKYINQKQMGAYYTKEDITEYICSKTVLPFLFDQVRMEYPETFEHSGGIWKLLSDNPDRYIHESVRHGITYDIYKRQDLGNKRDLPSDIAAGLDNVTKRKEWNTAAPKNYSLPTETWRHHIARRQQYEKVHTKLTSGEILSINDLLTYNLDIEKFIQDVISVGESPELVSAFWKAVNKVSVLDPTCGSGAFLFATLNILEPIYLTCLETIRGFLDDQKNTYRNHNQGILSEFRKIIDQIEIHSSEGYFILKSIMVCNLYGVDIMKEAVEICKLRLFLKLVAQLESYDQIEPLPDIDFNIRSGNTLVGFASLDEVKRALSQDMVSKLALPEIKNQAKIADKAFQEFSEMQTRKNLDAFALSNKKLNLKNHLGKLRMKLDGYLAQEHGIDLNNKTLFKSWQDNHQPFHWFVEFYGIMFNGGFDVIIGNPPYVGYKKIPYKIIEPDNVNFPDIYGNILRKTLALIKKYGRSGMIVPLSLTFSQQFKALRKDLCDWGSGWYSSYDKDPSALFEGVKLRHTIWVGYGSEQEVFVTPMYRCRSEYRPYLLSNITHSSAENLNYDFAESGLPKLSGLAQNNILQEITSPKLNKKRMVILQSDSKNTDFGFSHTAYNFISVFRMDPPCFKTSSLTKIIPSKIGHLSLTSEEDSYAALAATSGELFFWFWLVRGDGFDVIKSTLQDYLLILEYLPVDTYKLLIELGNILHIERNRWLVFNNNAGRCVGKYDFREAFGITRRADLLILEAISEKREGVLAVLDHVKRTRSINQSGRENMIPEELKDMFPIVQVEKDKEDELFSRIDTKLLQGNKFSAEELTYLFNND